MHSTIGIVSFQELLAIPPPLWEFIFFTLREMVMLLISFSIVTLVNAYSECLIASATMDTSKIFLYNIGKYEKDSFLSLVMVESNDSINIFNFINAVKSFTYRFAVVGSADFAFDMKGVLPS